ncbi:MurR/RpiR family transcriptional regulator, partial [Paraglaciecola chathamensis]
MAKIPFIVRIEQQYQGLSPNARLIADHLQHTPLDVLSCSVAEIAQKTQTSKATVSRFFRQLGYQSHHDAKTELNAFRANGYPMYMESDQSGALNREIQRIEQTWSNLDQDQLSGLIKS